MLPRSDGRRVLLDAACPRGLTRYVATSTYSTWLAPEGTGKPSALKTNDTYWTCLLRKSQLGSQSMLGAGSSAKEGLRQLAGAEIRLPGCSAPCPPAFGLLLDLRRTPRQPVPKLRGFFWPARKEVLRSSRVGVHAKVRSRRSPQGGGHERRRVRPSCCESSTIALHPVNVRRQRYMDMTKLLFTTPDHGGTMWTANIRQSVEDRAKGLPRKVSGVKHGPYHPATSL